MADPAGARGEGATRPRDTGAWGQQGSLGSSGEAMADSETGFPPRPDDSLGWDEWIGAGGPAPTIESGVRRGSDGAPGRLGMGWADALRLAGNAVVPIQVANAFVVLSNRLANQ